MIETSFTLAGKLAIFKGQVKPEHTFKVALYGPDADLNEDTSKYTTLHEIIALGYIAKSIGSPVYGIKDKKVFMGFVDEVIWKGATISAAGCMVFDETLDNLALVIVAFPEIVRSTNDTFTITPRRDLIVW